MKRTVRNPNHPHNILKNFLQKQKTRLRRLSNPDLQKELRKLNPRAEEVNQPRHKTIEILIKRAEGMFKRDWKKQFGWDFDDTYDTNKLDKHVRDFNRQNPGREASKMVKQN